MHGNAATVHPRRWVLWYNFVPHYSYAVAISKSAFGPFKTVDSGAGSTFRWGNSHRNPKYAGTNAGIGDFSLFKSRAGFISDSIYCTYVHSSDRKDVITQRDNPCI